MTNKSELIKKELINNELVKNVTIIMAMKDESKGVIDSLEMIENVDVLNPKLPMRCFQKTLGGLNISLVVNGVDDRYQADYIGSEAATLSAYEAVSKLRPDIIISAGTAGGFKGQGAEIGTVYLSGDKFIYHDRHVPLDGFKDSAIGHYPALDISMLAAALDLPTGIISTGSSLKKLTSDVVMIEGNNAVAKEMEAAAIAWVAMLFKTPVMAVKSITNLIDQNNKSEHEFVANLAIASEALHKQILLIIVYLDGKSIDQLSEGKK